MYVKIRQRFHKKECTMDQKDYFIITMALIHQENIIILFIKLKKEIDKPITCSQRFQLPNLRNY